MSKNPNQVTGKFYVRVDGKKLPLRGDATLNIGGKSREPVVGDEVHGYTEAVVPPKVDVTITHKGDLSLRDLNEITDATINVECDTGATYIISNAWAAGDPPELSSGGEVKMSFEGKTCEESLG